MSEKKSALGKGLGSLIPLTQNSGETGAKKTGASNASNDGSKVYFECKVEDIIPNANQPRKLFAKGALDELAASIQEQGIIQPLVVRPLGGGKYELIAGERRFRASKQIGLQTVPVVVKETDETGIMELALIENIQRQNLNPVEEALAYKELLSKHQYTQEELAKKLGKDRSSIANALRLLKLPDKIRTYLIDNKISMGHARALLGVDNKELQIQVANDIIENNLSVREVEVLTKRLKEHEYDDEDGDLEPAKTRVKAAARDYRDLVKQIERVIRQKVKIKDKGEKGQITITYRGEDELQQIVDRLLGS